MDPRSFGIDTLDLKASKPESKISAVASEHWNPGDGALGSDVAIDLGTSVTRVHVRGRGIVLEEPTLVAVKRRGGDVVDIGNSAIEVANASGDSVELVSPLRGGAISNSELAQTFLSRLLRRIRGRLRDRLRLVVSVPSSTAPIERRAVREASKHAGASQVHLIEHVMAAALGGDLPIHEPVGTMIVDVGGGVTEAAMLSLGCIVASSGVRTGGEDVDGAIKSVLRREYGMVISDRTAEDIKLSVSHVVPGERVMIEAHGRTALDGSTMTAILEREEVQNVVDDYILAAANAVKATLVQAPPELAQDLIDRGIHLAGGAALLGGLSDRLRDELSLPVHIMDEPDRAVIRGAGKCLEATETLRSLFVAE